MRKFFLAVSVLFALLSISTALALEPDHRVFTYGELLDRGDLLTDGEWGKEIKIEQATQLIWVDQEPGDRFMHDSVYILISAKEIKVFAGDYYPIVNGRSAFGTPPWFPETDYLVGSPLDIPNNAASVTPNSPEGIKVYAGPFALRPGDVLTDVAWIFPLRIDDDTMLVWIDLHPGMKFVHDTKYILIGPGGVDVIDGLWWPELNGRRILYGEQNEWGVYSAFDLYFE
jgi:hypothetical protein